MSKKLIAACMVIAAFAVVPSLAAAKPVITHPTGTVVPTGTKIDAVNVGNTIMTISGLPNLECSTATMTGTLTVNSAANGFEGEIETAAFGGTGSTITGDTEPECTGGLGSTGVTVMSLPWCLEGTEANDTFMVKGGKCGAATAPITFQLTVTSSFGTITCKYSRAAKIPGTFQTDTTTQDATATIANVAFTREENVLCPNEGKLDMSFTIRTDSTKQPVFIS